MLCRPGVALSESVAFQSRRGGTTLRRNCRPFIFPAISSAGSPRRLAPIRWSPADPSDAAGHRLAAGRCVHSSVVAFERSPDPRPASPFRLSAFVREAAVSGGAKDVRRRGSAAWAEDPDRIGDWRRGERPLDPVPGLRILDALRALPLVTQNVSHCYRGAHALPLVFPECQTLVSGSPGCPPTIRGTAPASAG